MSKATNNQLNKYQLSLCTDDNVNNTIASIAICIDDNSSMVPTLIELMPAGFIKARDKRSWLNDNPDQIIQSFNENKADLPIDIEHSTEIKGRKGEPAPAVGWIKELKNISGAIWAVVKWNDEGVRLLSSKAYRYISPSFHFDSNNKNRVMRILNAGLTNQPALYLDALANEQKQNQSLYNNQSQTKENHMDKKAICKALGLPESSSDEDINKAITALKENQIKDGENKASASEQPSLDKFVPRSDYDKIAEERNKAQTALATYQTEQNDKQINVAVEAAIKDGKITPATKDYHIAQCKTEGGLERFKEFIKDAPKILDDQASNKDAPPKTSGKSLSDSEKATCKTLGISEEEFSKYTNLDEEEE